MWGESNQNCNRTPIRWRAAALVARHCTVTHGHPDCDGVCMALFWETQVPKPGPPKPTPLSPLALALLLKLQAEAAK